MSYSRLRDALKRVRIARVQLSKYASICLRLFFTISSGAR
ncbi:unnamed protein product, partial [Rotaria sp. Silwood2]